MNRRTFITGIGATAGSAAIGAGIEFNDQNNSPITAEFARVRESSEAIPIDAFSLQNPERISDETARRSSIQFEISTQNGNETHYISGRFLEFWKSNQQLGLPISDQTVDENGNLIQRFTNGVIQISTEGVFSISTMVIDENVELVGKNASENSTYCPIFLFHDVINDSNTVKPYTTKSSELVSFINGLINAGYSFTTHSGLYNSLVNGGGVKKQCILRFDDGLQSLVNINKILKQISDARRIAITADAFVPSGVLNRPGYISENELKQISDEGVITIGAHAHYVDRMLTEFAFNDALNQCLTGKKTLEKVLGTSVTTFAYPGGRFQHNLPDALNEVGFRICSGTPGLIRRITGNRQTTHKISNLLNTPAIAVG